MNKYLNTGIKQVITEFPEIGKLLDGYGIGCVTCGVGTCLLKDIIEIHNLNKQQEAELMIKIEKIIYPEREVLVPAIEIEKGPVLEKKAMFSPPIKRLVEEHVNIKALLALIPDICEVLRSREVIDKQMILDVVDFIKSYADKFHHAKEEEILFKYTNENSDIIQVMLQDHISGRNFVKSILEGLENQDKTMIVNGLTGYKELLTQHIKKEDEVLYPWIEKNLSMNQIGEMYERFNLVDSAVSREVVSKYEMFAFNLKKELRHD
jgi:hemerythrin-like domain-containing protein